MKKKKIYLCSLMLIVGIIMMGCEQEEKLEEPYEYEEYSEEEPPLSRAITEALELFKKYGYVDMRSFIEVDDNGESYVLFEILDLSDESYEKLMSSFSYPELIKLVPGTLYRPSQSLDENSPMIDVVSAQLTDIMIDYDYDILAKYVSDGVVIVEIVNVSEEEKSEILAKVSEPTLVRFVQKTDGDRFIIDKLIY